MKFIDRGYLLTNLQVMWDKIFAKADETYANAEAASETYLKKDDAQGNLLSISENTDKLDVSAKVVTSDADEQKIVSLTRSEYDALVSAGTVDEDCYYNVTDDTPVAMSVDDSPVSGSQNLVTSGGVYSALDAKMTATRVDYTASSYVAGTTSLATVHSYTTTRRGIYMVVAENYHNFSRPSGIAITNGDYTLATGIQISGTPTYNAFFIGWLNKDITIDIKASWATAANNCISVAIYLIG